MDYNVYAIRNEKSRLYDGLFIYTTDEHAAYDLSGKINVRHQAVSTVVRVGVFNIATASLVPCENVVVPWLPQQEVGITGAPMSQTPISHEPPHVQETKFQERVADIGIR